MNKRHLISNNNKLHQRNYKSTIIDDPSQQNVHLLHHQRLNHLNRIVKSVAEKQE